LFQETLAIDQQVDAVSRLRRSWPGAVFTEESKRMESTVERIFSPGLGHRGQPFILHLKGTNFQVNVWRALLRIPEGRVVSYQNIAEHLGRPAASRAVAGAIAANPVGYLIPCHRVIAKTGKLNKYRWGGTRKKALIGWEAARLT